MPPLFTSTEAAALADAPKRVVEKAIEDRIFRVRRLRPTRPGARARRLLPAEAVICIGLFRQLGAPLPPAWKRRIYDWVRGTPRDRLWRSTLRLSPALAVEPEENWMRPLLARIDRYTDARERWIERRDEVKGATPVIRGTRITVYSIAGRLDHGETVDDILEDNGDLCREAIEAAAIFARANPFVGRPGGKPWRRAAAGNRAGVDIGPESPRDL